MIYYGIGIEATHSFKKHLKKKKNQMLYDS